MCKLEESIFFYTRNDYLIINNLLAHGNKNDDIWKFVEISNTDSKGVLKEHEDGLCRLNDTSLNWYNGRIYDALTDEVKARILQTAVGDISNIIKAMKPSENEIVLHRNVRVGDALHECEIGDIVEIPIISSASLTPFNPGYEFIRYEIIVPKGGQVLLLDQFGKDIRNEEGEVLLPPMACRVEEICVGTEKCARIIKLRYLDIISK